MDSHAIRSCEPLAEGIEFKAGFRAFHLCRSSRRFRKAGALAVATMADSNMWRFTTLRSPGGRRGRIDQITRGVHRIRAWAKSIKKAYE